ncbi:MAG: glycosyltransferase, partial [Lachnospiraceae bacterium]|nr:glycosyltransferase [Lachnospiraceae bacterium]
MQQTLKTKENIVLSIAVLASDRRDTIGKCLGSLAAIRKAVPSELIILDTGCSPETRRVLEEYADKIADFTWCNDFSKARNVTLRMAEGEWFLYLDDDEWFS